MNRLFIIGNCTADPVSKTTQDGKTVCNFTVAVNRRQRDANGNDTADFFRVGAWNKLGENCQKYLAKGKKVCVIGRISVHAFAGQDGAPRANMELLADEVEFLGGGGNTEGSDSVQPNMTPVENVDGLPF